MKRLSVITLSILLALFCIGCGDKETDDSKTSSALASNDTAVEQPIEDNSTDETESDSDENNGSEGTETQIESDDTGDKPEDESDDTGEVEEIYICTHCAEEFESYELQMEHLDLAHDGAESYICEGCGEEVSYLADDPHEDCGIIQEEPGDETVPPEEPPVEPEPEIIYPDMTDSNDSETESDNGEDPEI